MQLENAVGKLGKPKARCLNVSSILYNLTQKYNCWYLMTVTACSRSLETVTSSYTRNWFELHSLSYYRCTLQVLSLCMKYFFHLLESIEFSTVSITIELFANITSGIAFAYQNNYLKANIVQISRDFKL